MVAGGYRGGSPSPRRSGRPATGEGTKPTLSRRSPTLTSTLFFPSTVHRLRAIWVRLCISGVLAPLQHA
jgi:hypothetical protein